MSAIDEMAGAILARIDAELGVQEFKRTVEHDDGTTETFRIDITGITESQFTAASVRQRGEGPRRESGAKVFARGDRQGFASWLAGDPGA